MNLNVYSISVEIFDGGTSAYTAMTIFPYRFSHHINSIYALEQ